MRKVAKFGGTSLADSVQIGKVSNIIEKERPDVVVVSAPGKRFSLDTKVTDLLLSYYKTGDTRLIDVFVSRVKQIERELSISSAASDYIQQNFSKWITQDMIASRGEYVSGLLVSEFTGRKFIDPYDCIQINDDSLSVEDSTYEKLSNAIKPNEKYIIAGFYGRGRNGKVKTFTRGGSDTTGSIVARAIGADVYDNFTDVSGVFNANPKLVQNARPIGELSYAAIRAMAENGTEVFCLSAVSPVENLIPIHIRNTNNPAEPGTMIVKYDSLSNKKVSKPIAITKNGENIIAVFQDGTTRDMGVGDICSIFNQLMK